MTTGAPTAATAPGRARAGGARRAVAAGVLTVLAAGTLAPGSISPSASAAPSDTRRATTVAGASGASTSSTLPPLDCKLRRQILARYERQKARALTNAARADQRSRQAERAGNVALADALQGVIDEQEERIEIIQAAIDAVKARCK